MLRLFKNTDLICLSLGACLILTIFMAPLSHAACDNIPTLTASIVEDVVNKNRNKGQGTSVSETELTRLLQKRTHLNVSSAHKYDDLLGVRQTSQFARLLNDIDVKCSTPNGHFRTSVLFQALDVNNNGRITLTDSSALSQSTNSNSGSASSGGGSNSSSGSIEHIGTTERYSNGDITIQSHSRTKKDDLLLLFVHRTDGPVLKNSFNGWRFLVKCEKHPTNFGNNNTHCDHNGRNTDLGQTVFYREADTDGSKSYKIDMSGSKPTWAILTTLRNAKTSSPMRDSAKKGCDNSSDSVFPSVYGEAGDMLIMSQSFDDRVSQSRFGAPSGSSLRGYISGSDEAGFLYTKNLSRSGQTGNQKTSGNGASNCKDALISLTIKRK